MCEVSIWKIFILSLGPFLLKVLQGASIFEELKIENARFFKETLNKFNLKGSLKRLKIGTWMSFLGDSFLRQSFGAFFNDSSRSEIELFKN